MSLPRPGGPLYVADAGIETELIFKSGFDLPEFACFPLLEHAQGRAALADYYRDFIVIAAKAGAGLLLGTPTWRANAAWGGRIGYDATALDRLNREAVSFVREIAESGDVTDVKVSGIVGPLGDAYRPGTSGNVGIFQAQIDSLASAGVDVVEALTFSNVPAAVDVVRAANAVGVPVGILFTVEPDGALPDGTPLPTAVERVDAAGEVAYFGVNCAHPTHLLPALDGGAWQDRVAEFRPNASALSHAELDELDHLEAGDLQELSSSTAVVREHLTALSVLGGCCGTGAEHVAALFGVTA